MGDTAKEQLAAQLADLKRELRRKEKKLKKFNQVLEAKQHVRDTLRRHNIDSESESTFSSDLVNGHETQTDFKCSVSRTVTFSNESPKVIILSPVPSLIRKRKDKNHRYRSLSTRKNIFREREKAVIETISEASQKEVLQKSVEPRITIPYNNNILKCSDTPEESSNMRGVKASVRICNSSCDGSEMDILSDMSIHNDNTTILNQISLDSESGTSVSYSTENRNVKINVFGEEHNTVIGTKTEFAPNGCKRYPSKASVGCEATSIEDDRQTQDIKGCQPHILDNNFIYGSEVDSKLLSDGTTYALNNFPCGINRTEASNTYTVAVDNKKHVTSTHVLQQKSGVDYIISDLRNELESQDLFASQFVTQTENIEIKRSCISPRKRWKYKNSQSSCSEGSGCGTNDEENSNNKRESMGQNIIREVSIKEPLKHLQMQVPSNGEHLNEERMIKEMEQEMMREFDIESSQVDNVKNSSSFKEPLVCLDNERKQITKVIHNVSSPKLVDLPLSSVRKKENLKTVVRKNKKNRSSEFCTGESLETQCKHENIVGNGTDCKTVLNEECYENKCSAFINEIGPQKILCQEKPCHDSMEYKVTQNNSGISSSLVRMNPPCCNSKKLTEGITQMDEVGKDMIIDICTGEIDVHSVNTDKVKDSVNSDVTVHNVPDYSIENSIKFHSLVASEKHGEILTSSLVNLSYAGEESLYVLIVKEFGFTLWNTVKGRNSSVKSESQTNNKECNINEKHCTTRILEKEMWETVGEYSHHVGRTSDIRDIVAVGLPSNEEVRYLVIVTKTTTANVQMLYIQFNVKDEWQVIESQLGLSFCNTSKNLAACAVGEWSVAICWIPMEHFTNENFVITELDVTYSRRSKRWKLQCHSSLRSTFWNEPFVSLVALHQPDPRGVVLYTSSNKLYIYDAIDDIILHQFHWEKPAPSWAATNEDLVFLLSMDTSTGQTCLSAFNPMNGLQETFFTTVFPNTTRHCGDNTQESLKAQYAIRPICASLIVMELVVAFNNGVMFHVPTDASTSERLI